MVGNYNLQESETCLAAPILKQASLLCHATKNYDFCMSMTLLSYNTTVCIVMYILYST